MIVWINGAYGAGKTSCAYELQKRIPKAIVYDPENTGFFIRKNIPKELHKPDFQDHELWRLFNYEMLRYLAGSTDDIILVPMTLLCRRYYDEIIGQTNCRRYLRQAFYFVCRKANAQKEAAQTSGRKTLVGMVKN